MRSNPYSYSMVLQLDRMWPLHLALLLALAAAALLPPAAALVSDSPPRATSRTVSLPYFVAEPTTVTFVAHPDQLNKAIWQRGNTSYYYFWLRNLEASGANLAIPCLAVTIDPLTNNSIAYTWYVDQQERVDWRGATSITLMPKDLLAPRSTYRCVASIYDSSGVKRSTNSSELVLVALSVGGRNDPLPATFAHFCTDDNQVIRVPSNCNVNPKGKQDWEPKSFLQSGNAYIETNGDLTVYCGSIASIASFSGKCLNHFTSAISHNYEVIKSAGREISPLVRWWNSTGNRSALFSDQQRISIGVGETVDIPCRVALGPGRTSPVNFYKHSGGVRVLDHRNRDFPATLQLVEVTLADSGIYSCEMRDQNNYLQSETFEVTVLSPPYWIRKPPTTVYVNEGDSVTIEYLVGGSPLPDRLEFRIDGEKVDDIREFSLQRFVDSRSLQRGQSYSLGLRFTNRFGEFISTSVAIVVIKRLRISNTGDALLIIRSENDMATDNWLVLSCSAEFDSLLPRPEVQWTHSLGHNRLRDPAFGLPVMNDEMKSDRIIELGGNKTSTRADLLAINRDVLGQYTCTFRGFYGTVNRTLEITDAIFAVEVRETVVVAAEFDMLNLWWIIAVVVLFLLIMLIVLGVFCWRNTRGRSYNVDEKERRLGNDPLVEMRKEGFADYRRPDQDPQRIARDDLDGAVSINESLDGSELDGYGDENADKFNEDGSFIGLYSNNHRAPAAHSHTLGHQATVVRQPQQSHSSSPYAYATMAPGGAANRRQQAGVPHPAPAPYANAVHTLPHPQSNSNRPQVPPRNSDTVVSASPNVYSNVVVPLENTQQMTAPSYAPLTPPHSDTNMRDSRSHLDSTGNGAYSRGPTRFGVPTPFAVEPPLQHHNTLV